MNYRDKMEELSEYIKKFKEEFAEIEGLNSNYLFVLIDDSDNITIIPTSETGYLDSYRY